MSFKSRTNTCGELNLLNINESVTLNGWVAKKRDLGGILFIDLRDRYGITQIKVDPDKKDIYDIASKVGNEFVISVSGKVIERSSKNKNIPTGEIEVDTEEFQILNEAAVTPFVIEDEVKASEDLRLQYRYLDLRRPRVQKNLMIRNEVYQIVHKYFHKRNFVEIETPILMKSTPEGARDYLVPSRVHKGKFYALPQSPQTYKQILMVSGFDRYVQICKCFRDEDLRADRQPEFTQIDMEMSFVHQQDVFDMSEPLFKEIWKEILGIEIQTPFPQMSYDYVMENYGSDKPDLRIFGISKLINLSEIVKDSGFIVFENALKENGIVAGVKLSFAENKIDVTRKIIDGLTDFVKKLGFGGLGYIKYNADGTVQSPLQKFLSEDIQSNIKSAFEVRDGEIIFILSGERKKVFSSLGTLRNKIASEHKLIDESKYEFLWVVDFPLFHYDKETDSYAAEHHMFTGPQHKELPKFELAKNETDKLKRAEIIESMKGDCYDLVVNGNEIASGSIRIHQRDIQKKVFDIVGFTEEEQQEKFGFLLDAFRYGAPPHGGAAFGFDRIAAMLCGLDAIRDVIAFPKTVSAASLMDESPSNVSKQQLDELALEIKNIVK